jgi:WD40 repeat protein
MPPPLSIVLELTRIAEPDDPYAFRFEPQGYILRGSAGSLDRLEIPWSPQLLADLDVIRRPGRDPAILQRVGDLMQKALRPTGWRALGEQIRAASEAGRLVLVTLRSNAAELYALPWELLTVGAAGHHLGELPGVIVRQEWPGTTTAAELPSPRPEGGRVLFAWSAAGGAVPAVEHQRAISGACLEGHVLFDPSNDVIAHVSAARLAEALEHAEAAGRPFAVLHLLCHGGRAGATFGLVLGDEEGNSSVVDGGRLRQLLAPHTKTLRVVVLAACDGGNIGDPGNHLGSVAQALHRGGIQSVVASRYPLSVAGSNILAEALYRALLVDLHPLERALPLARARLARLTQHLDWASLQLYAREADGDDTRPVVFCPYRGLRAFEPEHRRFFFGRDAEREEALADMQALIDAGRPRFLVVYGASGTGKSSVLLAGVVPDVGRLKPTREGPWVIETMRPGATPSATLAALLPGAPAERPLLLIVDQFEEIFTHTEDPAERAAFIRKLWSLASSDSGLHVIVTLRVDFLGRCGDLVLDDAGLSLDRVAYDEAHRVAVARMDPKQVRDVLERPAERVGLRFAPGLLDRILADVGAEPGALPLLQYALGRLWAQRDGDTLTADAYEAMGGLVGALERDADDLVGGLAPEHQRQARKILVRLVDTRDDEAVDTRRRVQLTQIQPSGDDARRAVFEAALARLVDARLVVRSEDEHTKTQTLEIAHEALIRRWGVLRRWIGEDREKLAELERLRVWSEHQTSLTGTRLDRALEFVEKNGDDVDAPVRAFVEASEAERRRVEAEREAQRRRQRRRVIAVISSLSVMLLLSIGLGIWALGAEADAEEAAKQASDAEKAALAEAERANKEAERAQREAKRALSAQRVAGVRLALMGNDLNPADLILAEEEEPGASEGWVQLAIEAASRPAPRSVLRGHEGRVVSALFSPDGRSVVTASSDGTARVWRADGSGEPVVLRDHEGYVRSASFSPDGRSVITASMDGTARVWRSDGSGEPVVLRGHEEDAVVVSASFSPDGRSVVTASMDGTARVWRADGSGEPVVLRGHEGYVRSASFSPDGRSVITASMDGTARVWRADGSGEPVVLRGHEKDAEVVSASFSPDGRSIVTASDDGTARVWRADGSGEPVVLRGHEKGAEVVSVSFSPDGRSVVTASDDGTARVWRADGSGEPVVLRGHEKDAEVVSASFSPDGRSVVTASDDGTARVWRADGSGEPVVLRGHEKDAEVVSASFSPDGAASSPPPTDGTARVWRADSSGEPVVLRGYEAMVRSAWFSPDGRSVVLATKDGTARVWRADGSGEPVVLRGHERVQSAWFSPDGRSVVTASDDGTALVRRADGSGEPVVLRGHEKPVVSASFSPDGRSVVTASSDGTARVWRADGSGEPVVLRSHVKSASFSPDGRSVVTASDDGTARVRRADGSGEPVSVRGYEVEVRSASFSPDGRSFVTASYDGFSEPVALRRHERVTSASFSPDGRSVVTASSDGTAGVWRADGSGEQVVLRGHEGEVRSASFSPDGHSVVTASDDGTARVWRADGSGEPVVLRGHDKDAEVVSASFSPDGRSVVTASYDGTARVWRADSSGEPVVLRGHEEAVVSASFSPDGRSVVTASYDGTARIWTLDPVTLRDQLRARTTVCLTPEQRKRYLSESLADATAKWETCESSPRSARAFGR